MNSRFFVGVACGFTGVLFDKYVMKPIMPDSTQRLSVYTVVFVLSMLILLGIDTITKRIR